MRRAICLVSIYLIIPGSIIRGQVMSLENPFNPQKFYHHVVDNAADVAHAFIGVADINSDKNPDIIIFDEGEKGYIGWYEYPGFERHIVAEGKFHCERPTSADVDGDGDMDIITYKEGAIWFENPLPDKNIDSEWTTHYCGEADIRVKDYGFDDFDGDGKLDLVYIGYLGAVIFFQDGKDDWSKNSITYLNGHEGSGVGDIDNDGDPDIVHNGRWFETPDDPRNGEYKEYNIDAKWYNHQITWRRHSTMIQITDIDGDGKTDVVISHSESPGYPISWYSAEDPKGYWVEHVIDADFGWCQTLKAGDVDKDGDIDLMAGRFQRSPIENNRSNSLPSDPPYDLRIYYNPGETGKEWSVQNIANTGIYNGHLTDIGNDGDLDIVGIRSYWTGPVEIWENKTNEEKLSLTDWQYIEVDNSRDKYTIEGGAPNWRYFGLAMGDINRDGYSDIVSGEWYYENPGGDMTDKWKRIKFPIEVDASLVVDIDGDEFPDVIGQRLPEVIWLEPENAKATKWSTRSIAEFRSGDHGNSEVYASGMLIPKGKKDVGVLGYRYPEIILGAGTRDALSLIQIPENPEQDSWPMDSIIDYKGGYAIGDIDRDGFDDIAGSLDVETNGEKVPGTARLHWDDTRIAWWKNPGTTGKEWLQYTVGKATGPERYAVADINGDGRLDIIISEERYWGLEPNADLAWYEQPPYPYSEQWVRHVITTQYSMNSMDVADMDHDGDSDIIICEHSNPPKDTPIPSKERLQIWENDGAGNFTENLIDTGKESHMGARVHDLDGDGDLDIISIAWREYQYLHVWRNDGIK